MLGNAQDLLIVLIVAVILFFGAAKLPELFRNLGKAVGEFKKGRMEAELELAQMQQQQAQQLPQTQNVTELENEIKRLQEQLEQLKKQQTQKS